MTLAMEIEYGLTEAGRTVHLRKYWDDPVIAAHRVEWNKVRVLLKSVVAYSIEITTFFSLPNRQSIPLCRPKLAGTKVRRQTHG